MISLNKFYYNELLWSFWDIRYLFSNIKIESYSKWKNKQRIHFFHLKINIYENQISKFIYHVTFLLYIFWLYMFNFNFFVGIIKNLLKLLLNNLNDFILCFYFILLII